MNEKEIIKKCLDYIITMLEHNEIIRQKNEAVKHQSFEMAGKLRDEEKKLAAKILTLEEIKELREELNK